MTRKEFAVIGDPISQSLSPAIHRAAYDFLKVDWGYRAIQVVEGALQVSLSQAAEYSGFSVTMPLKYEAASLCKFGDEASMVTGVVNTLLVSNEALIGFNTDVFGIIQALSNIEKPDSIAVLGSGATSVSAIYACQIAYPNADIKVLARNAQRAGELEHRFGISSGVIPSDTLNFDLVINTVPGQRYSAAGTILLASYARDEALAVNEISGKEMLLWQALAQIRIFYRGSAETQLPNGDQLFQQMRLAISDL